MKPFVSVIIPTYNRPDTLVNRALASVFAQTYRNYEVLVIGDGTDLKTVSLMRAEPRVRFWNLPHQEYPEDPGQKWCVLGLEARNFGLDQAQGDWIAPLDDDDAWTEDHLEVLLAAADRSGASFAYGRSVAYWKDGHSSTYGNWPPGHFQFCDGSQVYRNGLGYRYEKECIERGLPEDGDLWDRMVAGGVTFTFVDRIVHYYYPNPR